MKNPFLLFFLLLHLLLLSFPFLSSSSSSSLVGFSSSNRRILHQPLFPLGSNPPPAPPEPVYPEDPSSDWPFFPQAPPGTNPSTTQTNPPPSNASPSSPTPSLLKTPTPTSTTKRVAIALSVSIAGLIMLLGLGFFFCCHRAKHPSESEKLFGSNSTRLAADGGPNTAASEFLYLGTLEPSNVREGEVNRSPYHKLNSIRRVEMHRPSPEIHPMPPLNGAMREMSEIPGSVTSSDEESLYYSPNGSSLTTNTTESIEEQPYMPESRKISAIGSTKGLLVPTKSAHSCRTSPKSRLSNCSVDGNQSVVPPQVDLGRTQESPLQSTQSRPASVARRKAKFPDPPSISGNFLHPPLINDMPSQAQKVLGPPPPPPPYPQKSLGRPPPPPPPYPQKSLGRPPPPPPPPPPSTFRPLETSVLLTPVRPPSTGSHTLNSNSSVIEASCDKVPTPVLEVKHNGNSSEQLDVVDNGDGTKLRLKPLHWDKVRATSDRATVWDQLKSSSFQLNEEMIETLFVNNSTNAVPKEATRRPFLPHLQQENRVLDPKKSQNIAILLRALNVTQEEVTEALLDGNPEGLGAELLESLVKMAPTKEEELKLRDYNGDVSKLGSAERFLKTLLDIPFAFKRVDAMLYIANFDTEVKYLAKSFETLEAACEELKKSRLFLKLLEAVLRTGNRMNVGTYRGEAKAFKLDTLLKLVDIKGTDGKTTLLHFVVQEIIRSERLGSENNCEDTKPPHPKSKEEDFKNQSLQVVAGLSRELENVKKSAGMDSDVLSKYVYKLEKDLDKIKHVLIHETSSTHGKFYKAMETFLIEFQEEILKVKAQEAKALHHVKEVTEYFHGDAGKEEAHPFRIFMVVRDFLRELDQVCKEVGKLHDRTMMGAARSSQMLASAWLPVLNRHNARQKGSSDDDSSSP